MRRFLIATAALVTFAAPLAASAQSAAEVRADKRDVAEEKQDLKREQEKATRDGVVTPAERREIQEERRDVADAKQELREDRQDMRQAAFDRNNRDWWKGRSEFADYTGRRAGYWYAPGYGYRQVNARYANFNWAKGVYVPLGYRNYVIRDTHFYGLRPAPPGARWIFADGNLLLMSTTGLILDVVPNAY